MDKQELKKTALDCFQRFMALDVQNQGKIIAVAVVTLFVSCSLLSDSDSHKVKKLGEKARPVLCSLEKMSAKYIELMQVNPMMEAQRDLEMDGVMAKLQHSDKAGANADVTKLVNSQNEAKAEYEEIFVKVKEIINDQGDKSERERLNKLYSRVIANPCQD